MNITELWKPQFRMYWRFDRYAYSYEVVGAKGGVALNISSYGKEGDEHNGWSAGIEYHRRESPDGSAPDHDRCYLLNCPCWHDGSSLYAQETWLPRHLHSSTEDVLLGLQHEAERYFNEE